MDARVDEAQQEVSRLMGRCVLRLQQYEQQLKSILANSDMRSTLQSHEDDDSARGVDISRQTLGILVRTFIGSVLADGEPATLEDDDEDRPGGPPSLRIRVRLDVGEEGLAATEVELRDLVRIRNELIHHFIEKHDLWTLAGCRAAQEDLTASCDRIGDHLARLRAWASDIETVLDAMGQHVRSETFHDWVVNGINPDGSVFWPGAGIVAALREASKVLAVDGWTDIAKAARWIAERYPHQSPEKYGCATLAQVLHESGQFDLCRLEKDGRRRRSYRLRNLSP